MTRRSGVDRLSSEESSQRPASAGRGLAALIGSGIALIGRANSIRLFKPAAARLPAVVDGITWREFEARICAAFRREGFRVDERGRAGPDPVIDLIAAKAKKRLLIQCKHWQSPQVSVAAIRELSDVVAARKADGGVVVCGGTFTKEAQDYARAADIRLIDGLARAPMLGGGAGQLDAREISSAVPVVTEIVEPPIAPVCPKCGMNMAKRRATRGKLAGHFFWSCADAPRCSGIVPCGD